MRKKKKTKKKIKVIDKHNKINYKQKDYFDIYKIPYGASDEEKIELQKYIYKKLNEEGVEKTYIEKLLDLTIDDIKMQFTVKESIENRVGIVLALFSLIIMGTLQLNIPLNVLSKIDLKNFGLNDIAYSLWFIVLCLDFILIIVYLVLGLKTNKYKRFKFDNKETNYKCATDDKNMALIRTIESYTNIWIKNEKYNEIKAKNLNALVIMNIIFVLLIVIGYFI